MIEITAKHNAVIDVVNKYFPFGMPNKLKVNIEDELVKDYIKLSKTGDVISEQYNKYALYSTFDNCSALDYIQAVTPLSYINTEKNIVEISPGFNGNFSNCLHVKSVDEGVIIKIKSPKTVTRGLSYVLSFDIFVTDETSEASFVTNIEPERVEDLIIVKDEQTFVPKRVTGKWLTKRYEITVPTIQNNGVPLPETSDYLDFYINIKLTYPGEFYLDNIRLFESKYEKLDNYFCNVGFVFSVINPIQNNGKILQSTDVVDFVKYYEDEEDNDGKVVVTSVADYNNRITDNTYDGKDIYLQIYNQNFDTTNTFNLKSVQNRPNPPKLHLIIKDSNFKGNTAKDNTNSSFMYLSNCKELVIDNCTFDSGTDGLKYGINWNLIQIEDAEVYIKNCTFSGKFLENAVKLNQRNGSDDVATDVKVSENQFPATIKAALIENCTFIKSDEDSKCILSIGSQGKGLEGAASPSTGYFPLTIITNDNGLVVNYLYKYDSSSDVPDVNLVKNSTYTKTINGDLTKINETVDYTVNDNYNYVDKIELNNINCSVDFDDLPDVYYEIYNSDCDDKTNDKVSIIMNIPAITVADYKDDVLCKFEIYVYNPSRVEYIGDFKYNPVQECVYESEPFILTGYILPPGNLCE